MKLNQNDNRHSGDVLKHIQMQCRLESSFQLIKCIRNSRLTIRWVPE